MPRRRPRFSAKEGPGHEGDRGHDGRCDEHVVGGAGTELPVRIEPHVLIIVGRMSTEANSTTKSYSTIIVERANGVVTITFNRPKRKNAANGTMWIELLDVLTEIYF